MLNNILADYCDIPIAKNCAVLIAVYTLALMGAAIEIWRSKEEK